MESLLPRLSVPDADPGTLDPATLYSSPREAFWLEIGFGGGEHLAARAEQMPEAGFVGAEPFLNGVAKLLAETDDRRLDNIRLCHGDARPLLESFRTASFDVICLLYPDPWPKKRHNKRRFVSDWSLGEFARLLKPGGELRIASDIPGYIAWTLAHMRRAEDFDWLAERPADWRTPYEGWPGTRYEAKAYREGRTPTYLRFRRR